MLGDKVLYILAAILVLRVASESTAAISYVVLAIYAFCGRERAIEALFVCWLFGMLNEALFPGEQFTTVGRYLVVFAAAASVFGRFLVNGRLVLTGPEIMTFLLGGFILLHSALLSIIPSISFLKGAVWLCATLTALIAFREMPERSRGAVSERILVILAFVAVASLAVSQMPEAYLPLTSLLRGILGHSQALGSVMAILATWMFLRAFARQEPRATDLALLGIAIVVLFLTTSRTALGAFVLSVACVGLMCQLRLGALSPTALVGLTSGRSFVLGAIIALIVAFNYGTVVDILAGFIGKYTYSFNVVEAYIQSRSGQIEEMWSNIQRNPLAGIGFGIASRPFEMGIATTFGVPVSAAIEKGVTPVAVWEELGLSGLLLFAMWTAAFIWKSAHCDAQRIALFFCILLLNLGEGTLFSPGGVGLIQIGLLGWIVSGTPRATVRSR